MAYLKAFAQREGHARVPSSHTEVDFNLGRWVSHRRENFKNGKLAEKRIAELEALKSWAWDPIEADYQKGLAYLKAFIGREGHARVPQRHTEGDFHLGNWASSRRMDFKKGKLSEERIADLTALKDWVWEA